MSLKNRNFVADMDKILNEQQLLLLKDKIAQAQRVTCVCHVSPDGDALGSTLGIAAWMKRLGKECRVVVPNRYPDFLLSLPNVQEIVRYDNHTAEAEQLLMHSDLIWVCDMNAPSRALGMEQILSTCNELASSEGTPFMVMVDHHLEPDANFCNIRISRPEMCATCEVLCHLLWQLGEIGQLSKHEATCLYVGMMTDTGAFTYASNRAVIYECISHLLATGIDKDKIYRKIFWTYTPNRMRLIGYMLYVKMQNLTEYNTTFMTLTNEERAHLGIKNGDTEDIVNMPLQIQDMRLSAFISEDTEHPEFVKFSLRSVGDFPCNEMSARFFNGGGHKNASGGRLQCTMDEAVELFKKAVREYSHLLKG